MATVANTDVKIEKRWSFIAFCKTEMGGNPHFREATHKDGSSAGFNVLEFEKLDEKTGYPTQVHLGESVSDYSQEQIVAEAKSLCVGENANGNYVLYKNGLTPRGVELSIL